MLVKLFPFDEKLLEGYDKPCITRDKKKASIIFSMGMIIVSLLFIAIGEEPKVDKAVYISPALSMSICAIVLLLSANQRKNFFGVTLTVLSISNFVLAICMSLSDYEIGLQSACSQTILSLLVYLVLLFVGYRLHFKYQMVHGTKNYKLPLSSEKSTLIALSGVILAKVFSRSFMVLVCWTVWIGLHLIIAEILLEYRKFSIYTKKYH